MEIALAIFLQAVMETYTVMVSDIPFAMAIAQAVLQLLSQAIYRVRQHKEVTAPQRPASLGG